MGLLVVGKAGSLEDLQDQRPIRISSVVRLEYGRVSCLSEVLYDFIV